MNDKFCTFCLSTHPLTKEFWYLGETPQCKKRRSAWGKEQREKHRDKRNAANKKWRETSPKWKIWRANYNEKNKEYLKEYARQKSIRDRDKNREYHLVTTYGITLAQYSEILVSQHNVCAICETPDGAKRRRKSLSVDHDHVSGKIRGLLCHTCNLGVGYFNDDPQRLLKALEYLRKTSSSEE